MPSRPTTLPDQRLWALRSIFGFCLLILAGRFYQVQVGQHADLQNQERTPAPCHG